MDPSTKELHAGCWNDEPTCQKEHIVNIDDNSSAQRVSDLELVKKAQQGDADAFAALYCAHKCKIYALCLRMTGIVTEAEDLTQDAFLQAFRRLSSFRGDAALSTWLYRVAVNTTLMHFRKNGRRVSPGQPSNQDPHTANRECAGPDRELSGSVDRIALARALQELPTGYRSIFLMHEVKGYDHKEIARLQHCTIGNSKSQLHKAKTKMRRLLGYGETEGLRQTKSLQPAQ
jgi:RNA polymerase sigma-70 factor (ECF subfamily)